MKVFLVLLSFLIINTGFASLKTIKQGAMECGPASLYNSLILSSISKDKINKLNMSYGDSLKRFAFKDSEYHSNNNSSNYDGTPLKRLNRNGTMTYDFSLIGEEFFDYLKIDSAIESFHPIRKIGENGTSFKRRVLTLLKNSIQKGFHPIIQYSGYYNWGWEFAHFVTVLSIDESNEKIIIHDPLSNEQVVLSIFEEREHTYRAYIWEYNSSEAVRVSSSIYNSAGREINSPFLKVKGANDELGYHSYALLDYIMYVK
jgi:hypothetical protein